MGERESVEAIRAAAYRAGAEAMRERAAAYVEQLTVPRSLAAMIRALPVEPPAGEATS